jgi:hypothetical protein
MPPYFGRDPAALSCEKKNFKARSPELRIPQPPSPPGLLKDRAN